MKLTSILFQVCFFYLAILMFDVSASDVSSSTCEGLNEGEEIRLDAPGKSMEFIPIPKQGQSDYCWATAGTTMFDAYRISKQDWSEPIKISSFMSTAFSLVATKSKNDVDLKTILNISEVVKYLFDHGSCRLRSFLDKKNNDNDLLSFSEVLKPLTEIYFLKESYVVKYRKLKIFFRENFARKKYDILFLNNANEQKIIDSLKYQNSAFTLIGTIKEILCTDEEMITTHYPNGELDRISMNSIFNRNGPNVSNPKNLFQKSIKKRIRQQLNHSPGLPQVLTMCSKSLYEDSAPTVFLESGHLNVNTSSQDCNNHYLVVLGMKKENQKCQLLVRNSAANSCQDYIKKNIICVEGQSPRQVWVDENYLMEYTSELYSFKN
ncbi:MAG: hypothetical protein QE271_00555 [Bacteriovoracaceae bacterium]|nr:hypothetical protein [Bacteriovoracaceae bacterium]